VLHRVFALRTGAAAYAGEAGFEAQGGMSKPRAETGKPKQIPISGGYREHFSKRISLTTTERIDFEGLTS
jgi:hypothetical protein